MQALSDIQWDRFEILLINDGSPDDSIACVLERRADISQLVVIDLSRNFGHHHAIKAGLQHARGELVFLIDCGLEVSPLILAEFRHKLREPGCDVVFGYYNRKRARADNSSR